MTRAGILRAAAIVAVALATAAAFVGGAQADRPNDRAGMLGVGATGAQTPIAAPDVFERAVIRHQAPLRPDDRGGLHGSGLALAGSLPVASGVTGDGFDWGDATFGAASALGLVLLGVAAVLTIRRRRLILD